MTTPSPHPALTDLYQKWLEVSREENRFIRESRWNEIGRHTTSKAQILEKVIALETADPAWKKTASPELFSLIHQVADLEQLNQTLIQERMKDVDSQLQDLQRRVRITRQIQDRYQGGESYGPEKFSGRA